MTQVLAGLPGVFCYIDDIVVWGRDAKEHAARLDAVLARLDHHGLRLNREKCKFAQAELRFLGHIVNAKGFRPNPELVDAIRNASEPCDIQSLRSWMGMVNHYLRFMGANYSTDCEPLRKLLREDTTWHWGPEQKSAFERIRERIASAPILAFFSPTAPTFLSCDASSYGIGAELAQLQPDGSIRPIATASRSLSEDERKYSTGEKEALACVWSVEKWKFLLGKRFVLYTDHQALVALLQSFGTGHKPLRISRWAARLLRFNFEVKYRPGKYNVVADALSRVPIPSSTDNFSVEDKAAICAILVGPLVPAVAPEELAAETLADPVLCKVLDYVSTDWPHSKALGRALLQAA